MILFSAFEPFGNDKTNVSAETVKLLNHPSIILPVSFKRAWPSLKKAFGRSTADTIISLGQSGTGKDIRVEHLAHNEINARIPDNDGAQPKNVPVHRGGATIFSCTLPLGGPVSTDAGRFVCNALMYKLYEWAHQHGKKAVFIHIPKNMAPATAAKKIKALLP